MNRVALIALVPLLIAPTAYAQQDHSQHGNMPGMTAPSQQQPKAKPKPKPKPKAKAKAKAKAEPAHTTTNAATKVQAADEHNTPGVAEPTVSKSASDRQAPRGDDAHAGHDMSAAEKSDAPQAEPDPHAGHDMSAMDMPNGSQGVSDPHAGHKMGTTSGSTDHEEIPESPPPAPATDHLADRYFDPVQMADARHMLHMEHGAMNFSNFMFDRLELQPADKGEGAYAWNAEFRYGGDIHRLVLKSEGEASDEDGLEAAEIQILYSRAISRYFDLQAGIRQDVEPQSRTYLTLGTEGLFPYWFDVEAAAFFSNEGELLGRVAGTYDLRLTQRFILQPAAEVTFSAQNIPELEIGSGISSVEIGLRLRYEIRREIAPYIGLSYERKFGDAADFARLSGRDPEATKVVIGLRAWF